MVTEKTRVKRFLHIFSLGAIGVVLCFVGTARSTLADDEEMTVAKAQKPSSKYQIQDIPKEQLKFLNYRSKLPLIGELEKKSKRTLRSIAPPRRLRFYTRLTEDEERISMALDEEIDKLFKLTAKYQKSSVRGKLWLRLGELYREKSQLIETRLQASHDLVIEKWVTAGQKGDPPRVNLSAAHAFNKKALELYQWFVADFPKDPKMDYVYYSLGVNHLDLGDEVKANSYFSRLSREFPKSTYYSSAMFELGEFHFSRRDWDKAFKSYDYVSFDRKSHLHLFAYYKRGWCHYRLRRLKPGILDLQRVVILSQREEESKDIDNAAKLRLSGEALRDLAFFFAESGAHLEGYSFFKKYSPSDKLSELTEAMARNFADKGEILKSSYLYRQILKLDQYSPRAPFISYELFGSYSNFQNPDRYDDQLKRWVLAYNSESAWAKRNKPEIVLEVKRVQEKSVRQWVLHNHRIWQTKRQNQEVALALYVFYLKYFSDVSNVDEMRFYYGELLFDGRRYDDSAQQYEWIIFNKPTGEFYQKALMASLVALEQILPKELEEKQSAKEASQDGRRELTSVEKRFEILARKFATENPKHELTPALSFKVARLHYLANDFQVAENEFHAVIKNAPKTKYAEYAGHLILDIYYLKHDFVGVNSKAQVILSEGQWTPAYKNEIRSIAMKASFLVAGEMESKGRFSDSAKAFDSFRAANSQSELAVSAYYNAGVNFQKAGDLSQAIDRYQALLKLKNVPPDMAQNTHRALIDLLEKVGRYRDSALQMAAFSRQFSHLKDATAYLFNSAVLFAALSDPSAVGLYGEYIKREPNPKNKTQALVEIGDFYFSKQQWSSAIDTYNKYLQSPYGDDALKAQVKVRLGNIYLKLHSEKKAESWFKETMTSSRRRVAAEQADIMRAALAEADFRLVELKANLLAKAYPQVNNKNQGAVLRQRLDDLAKLTKDLERIVRYEVADYIIASIYLVGTRYDNIQGFVKSAPVPAGLSVEDRQVYLNEVDKAAQPFRSKAIENYKLAVRKSQEFQTVNEWSDKALSGLTQLFDPEFGAEETPLPSELTDFNYSG